MHARYHNSSLFGLLPKRWVMGIATLGPLGYWGPAPGTNVSIAGLLLYTIGFFAMDPITMLFVYSFLIYAGVKICEEAEKSIMQKDPKQIILDECIATPLCFFGLESAMQKYPVWAILITGLTIFRLLDIFKPFFINRLQDYSGGWGVMLDDVGAAIGTFLCLHFGIFALDIT